MPERLTPRVTLEAIVAGAFDAVHGHHQGGFGSLPEEERTRWINVVRASTIVARRLIEKEADDLAEQRVRERLQAITRLLAEGQTVRELAAKLPEPEDFPGIPRGRLWEPPRGRR